VFCWTDSTVVLCWIKGNEKSWKPWVENRVVNIRSVVPKENWFHVSGVLNPADIPTRMVKDFNEYFVDEWFSGPSFLFSHIISKEPLNSKLVKLNDVLFEAKKLSCDNFQLNHYFSDTFSNFCNFENLTDINLTLTKHDKQTDETVCLSNVIDCKRYSSLSKLILVTGFVIRFVENLKRIIQKEELVLDNALTIKEYDNSLKLWIKDEQRNVKRQSNYSKLASSLKIMEKDLLRLSGRFGNSNWCYDEKYPIYLRDSESHFTKLVILDAHEKVLHNGINSTLAFIRKTFWICKGRKSVKDVLRKCVLCKRFQGRTMLPPPTANLPSFRINHLMNAFQATGLDYLGPLYIKDNNNKDSLKVYILLLTCASSRAIHLELVPDMKIPSFLRAFKRFSARRGIPSIIVHDNFKTFKSAEVKKYMVNRHIEQKFILPASPWWGGFYERLVRTVKGGLKKILGKTFLTFEELQTTLCDIELIINSRPLTYVNEDDFGEVITPSHLIFGRDITVSNKEQPDNLLFDNEECSKRVLHIQNLLKHFWKRFRADYLNELRQKHIYVKSKSGIQPLTVGDVVLIRDDTPLPRTQWRMGKVEELVVGLDNHTRGAKLSVISKQGRRTTAYRPLQKLIPFEITNNSNNEIVKNNSTEPVNNELAKNQLETHGEVPCSSSRPTRKAAKTGELLRRIREFNI